jgi:phosphoribosylglycinamide formyltransferase 2
MSDLAISKAKQLAEKVTSGLGGFGLFGVELFVQSDEVYFSEVSPRPHDTGLVTLISQNYSEFSLHARALLQLPIPEIIFQIPAASSAILLEADTDQPAYKGLSDALGIPGVDIKIFGKPELHGKRRMGVALALGSSIEDARQKANSARDKIRIS